MSWCAVDIHGPAITRNDIATWLVRQTGQAVLEREDGMLVGAADSESAGTLLDQLRDRFGASVAATLRPLPEQDWTLGWRTGLAPRRIGRLLVTPSWVRPDDAQAPVVVIDPETAFGTGEHGSTRTALALLDRAIVRDDRVLDLGSGSGILAIAAVKLGAARAIGVDSDPGAEPIARANAERNGVAARATFLTGDAGALAPLLGPAEIVLANILRSENERLLPAIRATLAPGGTAVFAGMEEPEASGFCRALLEAGFSIFDQTRDSGWWGVAARSP